MNALKLIKKAASWLSKITGALSFLGYILIILLTVTDVVLRKLANKPVTGAYELTQYLLLVAVFASFAYCQMLRGHIQVTMILQILPKRVVFILYTLTGLLTTGTMVFVGYAASQQAIYAMSKGYVSDVLKFPTYPFIWIECICMMIFALTCLVDVFYSVAAIFNKDLQDELMKEWN